MQQIHKCSICKRKGCKCEEGTYVNPIFGYNTTYADVWEHNVPEQRRFKIPHYDTFVQNMERQCIPGYSAFGYTKDLIRTPIMPNTVNGTTVT